MKILKNNLIAIYETKNKEEEMKTKGAAQFHTNFKVLLYNRFGKSMLACEEMKHQEIHYKLLKHTYRRKLSKEFLH